MLRSVTARYALRFLSVQYLTVETMDQGTVKVTKSKNKPVSLHATSVLAAINAVELTNEHLWIRGVHITCQNGDLARQGSWVFANSPMQPVRVLSTVSIARTTCLIPQLLTNR